MFMLINNNILYHIKWLKKHSFHQYYNNVYAVVDSRVHLYMISSMTRYLLSTITHIPEHYNCSVLIINNILYHIK